MFFLNVPLNFFIFRFFIFHFEIKANSFHSVTSMRTYNFKAPATWRNINCLALLLQRFASYGCFKSNLCTPWRNNMAQHCCVNLAKRAQHRATSTNVAWKIRLFHFQTWASNIQHVATRRNRVAKCAQQWWWWAQQCCDMLRLNVAIVWPGLNDYQVNGFNVGVGKLIGRTLERHQTKGLIVEQ